MSKDGGPAFPNHVDTQVGAPGMSLRAWLAGQIAGPVAEAMLAMGNHVILKGGTDADAFEVCNPEHIAGSTLEIVDALMALLRAREASDD